MPYLGATASNLSISSFVGGKAVVAPSDNGTGNRTIPYHGDELEEAMIRHGHFCLFRDEPIKFVTTTATAIGKMKRPDAAQCRTSLTSPLLMFTATAPPSGC